MTARIEMTALVTSLPGKSLEIKKVLTDLVKQTIIEEGCIEFQAFQDSRKPEEFVIWEIFESKEALKRHLDRDYTKDFFECGLTKSIKVIRHSNLRP